MAIQKWSVAVDIVNNVSAVDVMSSSAAARFASDLWVAVETWMEVRLGCGCLKHVVSLTAVHVAEGRVACCLQAVDTERHEHQPQHPQWHVSTRGGAVRQDGRGQAAAGREYTHKHTHTNTGPNTLTHTRERLYRILTDFPHRWPMT